MKILQSIKKEILETVHDHTMLAALIVFPIFVMLFMGSAFGSVEIHGLPIGVVGPTNTSFSAVLFSDLKESPAFNLKDYDSEESAMGAFRNGELRAIIIVPEDFEAALKAGDGSEVRIVIDNSDIALQEAVLAAMGSVVQASSTNITRSYVTAAWQDLYSLNQSAAALAEDINKSKAKMENTKASIKGIRQGIGNVGIDELEDSIKSAQAEVGELQKAAASEQNGSFISQSGEFLSNASFALNESIETINSTHSRLVDQSGELNDTIETLDFSIAALGVIKNSTSDNLTAAALDINIATLKALRNTTAQQADDVDAQIGELESLNSTLYSFSGQLEDYSDMLGEAQANQSQLLGSMIGSLSALNDTFSGAESTIAELRGLFGQIENTTDEIDGTLDDVLAQVGSVESLIDSLQDTVAAQTGKDPETIAAPLSVKVENQYVRESFVDFIIPRVIAVSLLFSCFLLASISLVREKSERTVVRLLLIPGAFANSVAAKIVSVTLISLCQVAMILIVGSLVFAVKAPSDLLAVGVATAVSALVLSAVGTLVGFYARTESAAIQTSLLIAIPMLFLGNIIFSPDLLPAYTQIVQQLLPLSHITNIFKIVLITSGDPRASLIPLLSYFVLLALIIALIVYKRRDITNYI
jgi:ABC-type Na+ efflux pump permease subunit